jgi:RNA polymerase sigma-70 factor (ECF subfamily)
MAEEPSFQSLIQRVRAGDEDAATEVVRRYEPAIRRAVRVRMRDPRLRRLIESVDICQSVFASFFVRTALGQYELETPEQLLGLLATIARNKLANQVERERAGRRDQRRVEPEAMLDGHPAKGGTPSRQIAARELLQEARGRMTPLELSILERREHGQEWADIAAELGGSPGALRVRLSRAAGRVARELGLEGGDDA